jgi:hypothetical protein
MKMARQYQQRGEAQWRFGEDQSWEEFFASNSNEDICQLLKAEDIEGFFECGTQ